MFIRLFTIVCLVQLVHFGILQCMSQAKRADSVPPVAPESCEIAQRTISTISNMRPDENLIIISRMSKGESGKLGWRRLAEIRRYLENSWKRDTSTIILAEGENVEGLPRIDFFVVGILADSMYVQRKKPLELYCKY